MATHSSPSRTIARVDGLDAPPPVQRSTTVSGDSSDTVVRTSVWRQKVGPATPMKLRSVVAVPMAGARRT